MSDAIMFAAVLAIGFMSGWWHRADTEHRRAVRSFRRRLELPGDRVWRRP